MTDLKGMDLMIARNISLPFLLIFLPVACTPTVQVAVPNKPIEINLNVKIEHEIRVKVDKELDDLFEKDSGLF